MVEYNLNQLENEYGLELERIIDEIKKVDAKKVLVQLPDGLKPWAMVISDFIEEKSSASVRIFLGDCFGACDVPDSECDLVIQFGHAPWN